MQEELLEVIDENGQPVRLEPRSVVHAKGLKHKGVYLLLFDARKRVFLQQRSAKKDLAPEKMGLQPCRALKAERKL